MPSIRDTLVASRTEIVASYQNGASTVALGKQYGCSNASIYVFLKDCGVELRQTANKYDNLVPDALRLLAQGGTVAGVADYLGIPKSTLQRVAKKNGYDATPNLKRCSVRLNDHAEAIIRDYQDGMSQAQIADEYNCDPSNICRLLKQRGIETRFHYECDHTFFDVIDSEVKAYALGFFTADGYNHPDGVVSVRIVDRDVLEKIRSATAYTGPIGEIPPPKKFPHRQWMYRLDIASQRMCEALTRLGCPRRKSLITRCPTANEVPRLLLRHYIRGLFDGNGSLCECSNGWHISIAGTAALLEPLRDFICEETGIRMGIYPHGKIYNMKVGGNIQVPRVASWMYADANIFMDRKAAIFRQLLATAGASSCPFASQT